MQNRSIIFKIPLAIALTSFSVFLLALVYGWMGDAAGVGAGFCEAEHDGLVKQPINTWSNLGFIFTGLFIGFSQSKGSYNYNINPFSKGVFFSTFYATLAVLLGPGSMAMHATTTHVGGFLDMLSMYLIASFLVAYATQRLFKIGPFYFSIFFFTSLGICIYFNFQDIKVPFVGFVGSFVFGLLLILTSILEIITYLVRKVSIDIRWGIAAILTMGLAFFIWNLSLSGSPYCDPSSLVQGHGIWHLLNALSVYFLYRYYVSENEKTITA